MPVSPPPADAHATAIQNKDKLWPRTSKIVSPQDLRKPFDRFLPIFMLVNEMPIKSRLLIKVKIFFESLYTTNTYVYGSVTNNWKTACGFTLKVEKNVSSTLFWVIPFVEKVSRKCWFFNFYFQGIQWTMSTISKKSVIFQQFSCQKHSTTARLACKRV